jgi:hypothetical protein
VQEKSAAPGELHERWRNPSPYASRVGDEGGGRRGGDWRDRGFRTSSHSTYSTSFELVVTACHGPVPSRSMAMPPEDGSGL